MKTKFYLILLCALSVMASCSDKAKFEEHQSTGDGKRWEQEKIFSFKPNIEDVSKKYQIILALRHVDGFQLRALPVAVKIVDPDGAQTIKPYSFKVFNDKNECLSECAGDFCDLEKVIEDNYTFAKKGIYTFEIIHTSNINPIPNVLEIGLIVKPIKE